MKEQVEPTIERTWENATFKNYMWVMSKAYVLSTPVILFRQNASRRAKIPQDQLADYQGALIADGYEGYQAVLHIITYSSSCWTHIRRKLIETQRLQTKGKNRKANQSTHLYPKIV